MFSKTDDFFVDKDDTEQMTAAFQAFMLQGKSKEATSTKTLPSTTTPQHIGSKTNCTSTTSTLVVYGRTDQYFKSLRPIVKAFQGRLQDWNHTDTQLEKVMISITNLQMRLASESHHQRHLQQPPKQQQHPWIGSGFRPQIASIGIFLTPQDIDMALDHDLLQNERMMATLRSLMASLADILEVMSRRLEEWIHIRWNCVEHFHHNHDWQQQQQQQQQEPLLEDAQQLYRLLAQDLYRKQLAVQQVLEDDSGNGSTSQEISKQALKEWTLSPMQKQKDSLMGRLLFTAR
jgi:hypothetical protein